jgi:hypothetical protein
LLQWSTNKNHCRQDQTSRSLQSSIEYTPQFTKHWAKWSLRQRFCTRLNTKKLQAGFWTSFQVGGSPVCYIAQWVCFLKNVN